MKLITITEKHSQLTRWFHWLNFIFLSTMIWSGILIYWADQAYIEIPDSVSQFMNLNNRLAEGMGWHFLMMWPFAINGIAYFIYLILSNEWKSIKPHRGILKEAFRVILHDFKILKSSPVLEGKYNPAQRIAYSFVIIMGACSLITGIALYKPIQAHSITTLLGGYKAARCEHFLLMVGFIFFFIIHIIQVMRAGWNNLRSMIAGYSIEKD